MKSKIILILVFGISISNQIIGGALLVPSQYSSIQLAITGAINGDTILVSPGTYYENNIYLQGKEILLLGQSGADATIIDGLNDGKIIRAQNGETFNTILDGFTIQNGQSDEGAAIYVISSSYLTVRNCKIMNNSAPGTWTRAAITIGNGSPAGINMYDCMLSSNSGYYGAAVFNEETGNTQSVFIRCIFTGNTAFHAPAIFGTKNASIQNCLFTENIATGPSNALISNEGGHPFIINSTFADNECFVIARQSVTDTTYILNCIGYNNAGTLTEITNSSLIVIKYTNDEDGNPGMGNINADPLFISPGDYHLQSASPCIDAGSPETQYNDPDNTRNDMGTYYYNQGNTMNAMVRVVESDLYIESIDKGIMVRSPDGQCWKIMVSNSGTMSTVSIACPY